MNSILDCIQQEKWQEALSLFLESVKRGNLTEEEYILGATILEHFQDWDSMLDLIYNGLRLNPHNYELYMLLGNYYTGKNNDQAFLSYENALYFAEKQEAAEDAEYIRQLLDRFTLEHEISVRNVSFVILSFNTLEYTQLTINSIRNTCKKGSYEIVVVDNASEDGSVEWLREQDDIILVENSENVGFPAGCNQGIAHSSKDNDIFLLNSDTMLMNNSLYLLRMGLYERDKYAATGAVTNYSSNNQVSYNEGKCLEDYYMYAYKNNIPCKNPYEIKSMLIMFATLIKRTVIDEIGELDELFTPGNCEDNDYGLRILQAGYQSILCHNAYIHHFGSKSFAKDMDKYCAACDKNEEKLLRKWGFCMNYYCNVRTDLAELICRDKNAAIRVLEVGCGLGDTLGYIKYLYPNSEVHGIELQEKVAEFGSKKFDIIQGNIEEVELAPNDKYDFIIFGDVLEHLIDPGNILVKMKPHLNDGGSILTSIPNVMNATVVYELLHGNFTYQDAGILDKTHLRFFTKSEILKMFDAAGYSVDHIGGVGNSKDRTDNYKDFFNVILSLVGQDKKIQFDVYQYIVKATPRRDDI